MENNKITSQWKNILDIINFKYSENIYPDRIEQLYFKYIEDIIHETKIDDILQIGNIESIQIMSKQIIDDDGIEEKEEKEEEYNSSNILKFFKGEVEGYKKKFSTNLKDIFDSTYQSHFIKWGFVSYYNSIYITKQLDLLQNSIPDSPPMTSAELNDVFDSI